jgi:uncharacterized membrane protein YgcG
MNSLQDYITGARERRDNQALAARIFSSNKDRRQSASSSQSSIGGSLASRVGVKKPRVPTGPRISNPRSINGEWTHDLYSQSDDTDVSNGRARHSASSLASSNRSRDPAATRRANLARGLERAVSDSRVSSQVDLMDLPSGRQPPRGPRSQQTSAQRQKQPAARTRDLVDDEDDENDYEETKPPSKTRVQGISIRGLAGPYTVMAQNLAPGTSTADIESAMMPVGGEMLSCKIIKTSPIMVVEMVFVSKIGADAVVEAFNNKTADGRIIRVYHKVGGYTPNPQTQTQAQEQAEPQTQPHPQAAAQVAQPAPEVAAPSHTDSWPRDQPDARQAPVAVSVPTGPRDSRRGRYSDDDEPMDDRDAPRPNNNAGREWGWDNDRYGNRNGGGSGGGGGGGGNGGGGFGRPSNGRFRNDDAGGNHYRRGWGYDTRPDHSRGFRR